MKKNKLQVVIIVIRFKRNNELEEEKEPNIRL